MGTIKAYSKAGDEFERRNFGSITHPNYGMIESLTKASTPVAKFTLKDAWWGQYRCGGTYKLGGATAELERDVTRKPSGEFYHTLDIECIDIDAGKELYTLIRSGKILPTMSFEDKQIDTPALQLRDLARIWWRSVVTSIRARMSA